MNAPLPPTPMPPATLEALFGSRQKWRNIAAGTGVDLGPDNCPLCQLFHGHFRKDRINECKGCPVRQATGKRMCIGTPYEEYHSASEAGDKEAMHAHALEELAFLESLIPAGVAP